MKRWGPLPYIVCGAAFAAVAVAGLWPLALMLWGSVSGEHGLAAYGDVLADARQQRLLLNTLGIAASVACGAMLLGGFLAFALARVRMPMPRVLLVLYAVPILAPPYLFAMAWVRLFGHRGAITEAFVDAAAARGGWFSIYGPGGVTLVLTLAYYPLVLLITYAAFALADKRQEEAAYLQGGWLRTLRSVTWPSVWPAWAAGGLLVFLMALGSFGVASLLQVQVYSLEVFTRFSAQYDVAGATAAAVPLLVLSLGLFFIFRLLQRRTEQRTRLAASPGAIILPLGRWRWLVWAVCLAIAFVSTILPTTALLVQAGGFAAYREAFRTAYPQLANTMMVSAIAATAVTALGFLLAYSASRGGRTAAALVDGTVLLLFVVPGTVLAIGMIRQWNHGGLAGWIYGSAAVLIIAAAVRYLAVAQQALRGALARIGPRCEEAALVSGASWLQTLRRILLPLLVRPLAAVWLLSFILATGELSAGVLLSPPGFTTFSVRLFTLMHYGMNQLVAALAIILLVVVLLPLLALAAIAPRAGGPRHA